jgi:sirohydrochlorin cobaltochelatase
MLLLVGHGSRRESWRLPLEAMRDRLAERAGVEEPIRLAYLEACPPTVAEVAGEAVEAGETRLLVLPLFISAGGHVRHDLAPQVEAVRRAHPELTVELLPALGEHPLVLDALAAILHSTSPHSNQVARSRS